MSGEAPLLRFQRPAVPALEEVDRYFARSRQARWLSNGGPCHRLLVERCSEFVGAIAVPVANATAGLMLALRSVAGRPDPPRHEVLLPSFTFVATAAAAAWAGFEPVLVDVEPNGWHLDHERLRQALAARGRRVAAVIACSTFGTPPAAALRGEWESACRDAGVPLVVDSAAGFGAGDELGRPLGGQGNAEVFSFHATKPTAIGEGGLVCSRDPDLAARVSRLATFGFDAEHRVAEPGLNAKLDEWHAATALAAIDRLPSVLATRRRHAAAILDRLSAFGLTRQAGAERATWQFIPVLARDAEQRDAILAAAERERVELRTYFDPPLHRLDAFRACARADDLEVTESLAPRCLSLPMANDLSDEEVSRIVAAVRLGCEP